MAAQLATGTTVKQVTSGDGRIIKKIERRSSASAESNRSEAADIALGEGAAEAKPRDRCLFDLMN